MMKRIKRGEIYLADLTISTGSEQNGVRPVLIIQNNKGNKYSPTTIVACLSTKILTKAKLPTHHVLPTDLGLKYPSMVLCEQIKVIDKSRLMKKIGSVGKQDMRIIDIKIRISLEIKPSTRRKKS